MRSSATIAALVIILSAGSAFGQDRLAQDPQPQDPKPQTPQGQSLPPTPQDPQKPPAVVGEEGTKPTRSFFPALGHNLKDDFKHLPRRNTLYVLALGGAAALAIHPLDDDINKHLEGSGAADAFFKPGSIIGQTPLIVSAALATYIIGRHTKSSGWVSHLGMDEIEGQIISGIFVIGLKETIRRERPIRADGTRASGFSLPSGHSTATFTAATILQQHLGYKAGVPTYLIASYVAMSRLHENVHNASDVVFGAALGIAVGRTVTWHGRNFYASPMLVPKGTGIVVNVDLNDRSSLRHP